MGQAIPLPTQMRALSAIWSRSTGGRELEASCWLYLGSKAIARTKKESGSWDLFKLRLALVGGEKSIDHSALLP